MQEYIKSKILHNITKCQGVVRTIPYTAIFSHDFQKSRAFPPLGPIQSGLVPCFRAEFRFGPVPLLGCGCQLAHGAE